jgi:hypothetical protein
LLLSSSSSSSFGVVVVVVVVVVVIVVVVVVVVLGVLLFYLVSGWLDSRESFIFSFPSDPRLIYLCSNINIPAMNRYYDLYVLFDSNNESIFANTEEITKPDLLPV